MSINHKYSAVSLVLYKSEESESGTEYIISRILKKRTIFNDIPRYLIQHIDKSSVNEYGTGIDWNDNLKDNIYENLLFTSPDPDDPDFPFTDPTDILQYVIDYFWSKFTYDGNNAKASQFILKYILPSIGNWNPPASISEIEDHDTPHHPNTGISWGHNDSNTMYRLHIPNYPLWLKNISS